MKTSQQDHHRKSGSKFLFREKQNKKQKNKKKKLFLSFCCIVLMLIGLLALCQAILVPIFISMRNLLHRSVNVRIKGHLGPTHLKSSPVFTFSTQLLDQDSQNRLEVSDPFLSAIQKQDVLPSLTGCFHNSRSFKNKPAIEVRMEYIL